MKRNEVPVDQTWDLGLIYQTPEDAWKDLDKACELADAAVKDYKGHLKDADHIVECLHLYEQMSMLAEKAYIYFSLAMETDYSNSDSVADESRAQSMVTDLQTETSFIESEILEAEDSVLKEAVEKGGSVAIFIKKILRRKPHVLHPETEKALAALGEFMETPYQVYNQAKLADMRFDDFDASGSTHPLSYSLFEDEYEYEPDTEIRRAAFRHFSDKIREYENVTAAAYNAYVCRDKRIADLRGFSDVFDYLLFEEEVPRELYDRQIDVIMEKLAPHMRRYAELIKRTHRLDRMTYADLKLPVDSDFAPRVSREEAEQYIADGLSVMGDDYVDMIHHAFSNRWIDFATNDGKCTGGFCESPYGVPASFILLSFQNRMSDVFTLAHELGHAGHFKACNEAQGFFDVQVPMYYVESPSTINELLMTGHLSKNSDDLRFRRWALGNMVGNTYYHNCVTHLLEAAYQREVYKIIDGGGSVQADTLSAIYKEMLKRFWGDTVELTDGAELTWMRQPHYYMGLYSYSYSASLTIATGVYKRIQEEGQTAVDDWKKALRAGCTVSPMEFAKMAGVDISTDKPLNDMIDFIGSMIDEMYDLTDKLDD